MDKTMDKNRELAELMGFKVVKNEKGCYDLTGPFGVRQIDFVEPGAPWSAVPKFDKDLNIMAEVEKYIGTQGYRWKYAEMVRNRIGAYHEEHLTGTRYTSAWGCLTAPARVRRDIAIIALKEAAKLLKGDK